MVVKEYTHSFCSKSGEKILVRQLRPDDTPLLVDLFDHMTSESRYRRYHQTLDHVAPGRIWQEAQSIAHADPDHNHVLLAFDDVPGEGAVLIGAVRFVETSPFEAEVAISVRDDYQDRGIGTQLMRLLAGDAEALGYLRLVADIQNDNPAIWQVFNKLPYKVSRSPNGHCSGIMIELNGN